jgi:hypothetical protein
MKASRAIRATVAEAPSPPIVRSVAVSNGIVATGKFR